MHLLEQWFLVLTPRTIDWVRGTSSTGLTLGLYKNANSQVHPIPWIRNTGVEPEISAWSHPTGWLTFKNEWPTYSKIIIIRPGCLPRPIHCQGHGTQQSEFCLCFYGLQVILNSCQEPLRKPYLISKHRGILLRRGTAGRCDNTLLCSKCQLMACVRMSADSDAKLLLKLLLKTLPPKFTVIWYFITKLQNPWEILF